MQMKTTRVKMPIQKLNDGASNGANFAIVMKQSTK